MQFFVCLHSTRLKSYLFSSSSFIYQQLIAWKNIPTRIMTWLTFFQIEWKLWNETLRMKIMLWMKFGEFWGQIDEIREKPLDLRQMLELNKLGKYVKQFIKHDNKRVGMIFRVKTGIIALFLTVQRWLKCFHQLHLIFLIPLSSVFLALEKCWKKSFCHF